MNTAVSRQSPASALKRAAGRSDGLLWRVLALVLVLVIFGIVGSNFWSQSNWLNTSVYATSTIILALAELVVILTAGIDISAGANTALSGALAAYFLAHTASRGTTTTMLVILGLAIGIAAGALVGFINGMIITRLVVPPFIATIGMLGIASGLVLVVTNGVDIPVPDQVNPIGNSIWFGWIPITVAITVLLCAGVWYLLGYTKFGVHTYAIGNDAETARRMGIDVKRHLTLSYTLCGALAGIGGVMLVTRFLNGDPNAGGDQALLNAIAAVAVGGVSLFGGKGTVLGTLIGAIIVAATVTGLVLAGVSTYWQTVAVGLVIISAVCAQHVGDIGAKVMLAVRRAAPE